MGCPDDITLALAAQQALGLTSLPALADRRVLHATQGRAVERVRINGRPVALKWRDDRVQDREALLYRGLLPPVHRALGAAPLLGATCMSGTHLLFLAWVEGVPADWAKPADVRLAFEHLGRVHALTGRLIADSPEAFATAEAWAELLPRGPATARDVEDPLVLDPGDLHADNFLLLEGGGVCLLDFENMAVRPRGQALRQLRDDTSMPQGRLGELALSAYWAGTG